MGTSATLPRELDSRAADGIAVCTQREPLTRGMPCGPAVRHHPGKEES